MLAVVAYKPQEADRGSFLAAEVVAVILSAGLWLLTQQVHFPQAQPTSEHFTCIANQRELRDRVGWFCCRAGSSPASNQGSALSGVHTAGAEKGGQASLCSGQIAVPQPTCERTTSSCIQNWDQLQHLAEEEESREALQFLLLLSLQIQCFEFRDLLLFTSLVQQNAWLCSKNFAEL